MTPYYSDSAVTIYHGDCREILPDLPKVDLVLTDPPYFLPAHHHATRAGTSKSWGNLSILEHFFSDTMRDIAAIMKSDGVLYCFCDGKSYPIFFKAAYSQFKTLRCIVWDKLNCINGYDWRHQHELILFAKMEEAANVPTGDGDVIRQRCVPVAQRIHDAEKPTDLMVSLIGKHDLGMVLDPFMGSGTTLRAAKDLGRKAIGIEIEEKYCEISAQRMAQEVLDL